MAIKGCARQMVVLNGTGGSMFETAYFIVKADAGDVRQGDLLREANRIIEESCFTANKRRKMRRGVLFFAGMAVGALAVGLLWLVFSLVL
ncbi:MAG: hypothetical protein IJY27_05910 [Clostridia bacterium]|nr:hypothetical protein [Clostridia bacterium]